MMYRKYKGILVLSSFLLLVSVVSTQAKTEPEAFLKKNIDEVQNERSFKERTSRALFLYEDVLSTY